MLSLGFSRFEGDSPGSGEDPSPQIQPVRLPGEECQSRQEGSAAPSPSLASSGVANASRAV